MKTYYDQRRELSIHARHFGEASFHARITYGTLLILFALIIIVSSYINDRPRYLNTIETPTKIEVAKQAFASRYSTEAANQDLAIN
ncbi:MAG: hypothetical protein WBA23_14045 [Tunicatimonas sp.]|uniref:hypothetical protein n=1 Tax=Tunicatimonas sp. TaxID=1940096 RepID=UPI003C73490D